MEKKSGKDNKSVEKALTIIEIMAKNSKPMRLQEISRKAGLPASTAMRFLNTLAKRNYVSQDHDSLRYALTLKLCNVAGQISFDSSMRELIRPRLSELAEVCGESACLAIKDDDEVVYIDVVDGPDFMLRTLQRIGKRAPLHSTGVGKCLLLDYDRQELEEFAQRSGLAKLTENTITEIDELYSELLHVREIGYAIDNEECEYGVRCIAMPVRDYTKRVVASVSISGPATRLTYRKIERIAPEMQRIAARMSQELGLEPDSDGESQVDSVQHHHESRNIRRWPAKIKPES